MSRVNRFVACLVSASMGFAGVAHGAGIAMVGTDRVAAEQGVVSADTQAAEQRAHVLSYLDRPEVVAGLVEKGVTAEQARERVAALTDAEVVHLAQTLDTAPAGAGIVGTIVFIFVLLLVTDVLGLTKVFPFTRSVR